MTPMNVKSADGRLRSRALIGAIPVLVLSSVLAMMFAGCGQHAQFRITNATGQEVAVTGGYVKKTVSIPNQKAAHVVHTRGKISVKMPDGKTWVYSKLSPLDLRGTPFMVEKHYTFFGVQDGYVFRGSYTVNLLLHKNGRLYAVLPDAEDMDIEKLKQPKGFPVKPDEAKERKNGKERPHGDEKNSQK